MIRRGSCSKKLKIWLRIRTVRGKGRRKDSALCFSPGRSLGAPVCLSVCLSWRGGVRPEDWSKSASASALAFPTPLSSRPWRPRTRPGFGMQGCQPPLPISFLLPTAWGWDLPDCHRDGQNWGRSPAFAPRASWAPSEPCARWGVGGEAAASEGAVAGAGRRAASGQVILTRLRRCARLCGLQGSPFLEGHFSQAPGEPCGTELSLQPGMPQLREHTWRLIRTNRAAR